MSDLVVLMIVAPFMALVGITFLGTAALMVYRDVLGIDDKVSEWLDRAFGSGYGLARIERASGLPKRLMYAVIAVVLFILAYLCIRYGVVEPIAEYVSG